MIGLRKLEWRQKWNFTVTTSPSRFHCLEMIHYSEYRYQVKKRRDNAAEVFAISLKALFGKRKGKRFIILVRSRNSLANVLKQYARNLVVVYTVNSINFCNFTFESCHSTCKVSYLLILPQCFALYILLRWNRNRKWNRK